jgi:hypothetical protein
MAIPSTQKNIPTQTLKVIPSKAVQSLSDDVFVPDTCANCPDSSCCTAANGSFCGSYDDDPDGGYLDDVSFMDKA